MRPRSPIWPRRGDFAEGVHKVFPGKLLAYNCSPSFNWKKNLDDATIATFQRELAAMGYSFQFITLAGFHALNFGMFELARAYGESGMSAYCRLQEKEFLREKEVGYEAVKHQRFVGTGYFDAVQQVITSGTASTVALHGSTEAEQFTQHGNGRENGNGHFPPSTSSSELAELRAMTDSSLFPPCTDGFEDLMPSGD